MERFFLPILCVFILYAFKITTIANEFFKNI